MAKKPSKRPIPRLPMSELKGEVPEFSLPLKEAPAKADDRAHFFLVTARVVANNGEEERHLNLVYRSSLVMIRQADLKRIVHSASVMAANDGLGIEAITSVVVENITHIAHCSDELFYNDPEEKAAREAAQALHDAAPAGNA